MMGRKRLEKKRNDSRYEEYHFSQFDPRRRDKSPQGCIRNSIWYIKICQINRAELPTVATDHVVSLRKRKEGRKFFLHLHHLQQAINKSAQLTDIKAQHKGVTLMFA